MKPYELPPNYNLLGIDLATNSNGDLAIDTEGEDLAVVRGPNNAISAFIRELMTPFGYLSRYVYDYEGIKALDEDYGNPIYAILAEPLTQEWLTEAVGYVNQIAKDHPRLTITNISYDVLNDESTNVMFKIGLRVETVPTDYSMIIQRTTSGLQVGIMEGQ